MLKFFIERPIFASVLSIAIVLAGLLALKYLPIELYPNIVPPQISVSTTYTGSSADAVANNIAAPIEKELNGIENMIYMHSRNASNGQMNLNVFFEIGTHPDKAQIDVQNKVNLISANLPQQVQGQIQVQKTTTSFLLILALHSPTNRYDSIYINNYAGLNIIDVLKRVQGVNDANIFGGGDYAMRIWLKPDMMAQLGITTTEIVSAIRAQNHQYPIGEMGAPPTPKHVDLTFPIITRGRLTEPAQYENIILKATPEGAFVRIKDVGRVELGAESYAVSGELNGKPTTLIAVYQDQDANALQVAKDVRSVMEKLAKDFPAGIEYSIPYDTTIFDRRSIKEVFYTVFEATILVILVMFLFLQNIRATLIPIIALFVSIIGTFAGMYLLGFSLNTLTLFGLVLAIGIVVDDAIVVVENVERNMREKKISAKDAAIIGMKEVTWPVIAIVFVLCAVFIPVAFLGGIAGQLYKQFAITICISVIISGIVALTLSPALSAIFLKDHQETRFTQFFHKRLDSVISIYMRGTQWLLNHKTFGVVIFLLLCSAIFLLVNQVPKGFVPEEDQGYFAVLANLPDAASLSRTEKVTKDVTQFTLENPAIENIFGFSGYSLIDGQRSNAGTYFPILKDWEKRTGKKEQLNDVMLALSDKFSTIQEAQINSFNPPPIAGLSKLGGFEFWIVNKTSQGLETLTAVTKDFIRESKKRKELSGLSLDAEANSLQLFVDLDREKAKAYGVEIRDVFETLNALFGSIYVNDFNKLGRVFQVQVQAEPAYRQRVEDIRQIYVRSTYNKMIPLTSLVTFNFTHGPTIVSRFDGFPALQVRGNASKGYSSGDAMAAVEAVADELLPEGMSLAWSGSAYQEKMTGGTTLSVLFGGLLMIFLILSALFNRWSLPFAILLAVPFGFLGAFASVWLFGMTNDIYFQIGLVTLVALGAKNAILIVEFANHKRKEGATYLEAALLASRLRFRAILMTSLTFIFGVLPLVYTKGAGAASRHSVGVGVLGGMITATLLGIFFVPLFYTLTQRIKNK